MGLKWPNASSTPSMLTEGRNQRPTTGHPRTWHQSPGLEKVAFVDEWGSGNHIISASSKEPMLHIQEASSLYSKEKSWFWRNLRHLRGTQAQEMDGTLLLSLFLHMPTFITGLHLLPLRKGPSCLLFSPTSIPVHCLGEGQQQSQACFYSRNRHLSLDSSLRFHL